MSLLQISLLLIIGSITGLGIWLQFHWPIMGQINRWKAKRYIKREAKRVASESKADELRRLARYID